MSESDNQLNSSTDNDSNMGSTSNQPVTKNFEIKIKGSYTYDPENPNDGTFNIEESNDSLHELIIDNKNYI